MSLVHTGIFHVDDIKLQGDLPGVPVGENIF
jgi:hypothetical protein